MQGVSDASSHRVQPNLLEKWNFAGCGPTCIRNTNPTLPSTACGPACEPITYRGTLHALRTIARSEGVGMLWRGTDVAIMMAIPMVGIYLPLYDYLLEAAQSRHVGVCAPLLAGSIARTAAVFCTAPFELVRTRMQAVRMIVPPSAPCTAPSQHSGPFFAPASLLSHVPTWTDSVSKVRALRTLWTGVGATLARDVPFSALYWAMVEPIRACLLPHGAQSELEVMAVNVAAGGAAGGLAGAVTTPLDLVKTRTQLAMGKSHPLWSTLRSIVVSEGAHGLFQGWSARAAKAAPACAIVLSAYEMLKFLPSHIDDE